ncbi:MAG: hypothetical protein HY282_02500 [Nitrospirae bacterium]|nr:hypothetical protein [Candidatus Manganitrophaceae bacterium]
MRPDRFIIRVFFFIGLLVSLAGMERPALSAQTESAIYVAAEKGRLTVRAADVSLGRLFEEIGQQMEITIYGEPRLTAERITISLRDLPIEEGLRRILAKHDFAVLFSNTGGENGPSLHRLTEVWIFPDRGGPTTDPTRRDEALVALSMTGNNSKKSALSIANKVIESMGKHSMESSGPALLDLLQSPDRSVRLGALDALNNLGSLVPSDQVVRAALRHDDPQTRIAVLTLGFPVPREALIEHALYDPSAAVRLEALHALEGDAEVEKIAGEAVRDSDPMVRETADRMLEGLKEKTSFPAEEPAAGMDAPETGG